MNTTTTNSEKVGPVVLPVDLRDYIAIHANEEDIRHQGEVIRLEQIRSGDIGVLPDGWHITARYMHADAMLKTREVTA